MWKTVKRSTLWGWIFFGIIVILYIWICFYDYNKAAIILNSYLKLIRQILPVLLFVFILMFLVNYFVNNDLLRKYMWDESWVKGWIISIIWWILSTWPIYAWYPLIQDLKKKWIKDRYLITFLYNRWIKLQWLPILVSYFWIKYSITLLIVMVIFSILQWLITEKLINLKFKI